MRQHNLRLSDELWEQVEQRRGKVPRNPWIVGVLQEAVERASGEASGTDKADVSRRGRDHGADPSPAPAEQPRRASAIVNDPDAGWDDQPAEKLPPKSYSPAPAEQQPKEKPGDLWFARPREFRPYPKESDRKKKR